MKVKKLLSVSAALAFVLSTALGASFCKADTNNVGVTYQCHVQNIGWQSPVNNDATAGTEGQFLRVEALKLNLTNAPKGASIKYKAHVQDIGWQPWTSNGSEAGTHGQSLRVEAIKIELQNMPGYSIQYQTYVQNVGWQNYVSDGQEAGTHGQGLGIEALRIKIVHISDNSTVSINYQSHVQNIGWQDAVENGQISGTEGESLRVEALKLNLIDTATGNALTGDHIKYQTHVQNIGWQNPVTGGYEAGTHGQGLRVEAIKISLENMPDYSIQYRAHVQDIGWQPWVSDGAEAGTDGKGLRIEAIEIRIVKIGTTSTIPISSVSLNKTNDTLNVGDTDTLTTAVSPDNATNKSVTWTSSDPGIAAVDENGKITAVKDGTTTITAATQDGSNLSASCMVTVNKISVPVNIGYTAPLPNPKYIDIKPISQCAQRLSTAPNSEYITVKDGKYVSPNDTDSPAARAYNNTATGNKLVSADLSDAVDINMHGGYLVERAVYSAYEDWYSLGEKDMANTRFVINANYQNWGYGTIAEPANFKVLGVYAESTTLNSNDVTKLTAAASTLHTQFMDKSQYDPDVTYEHYTIVYDTINKTNIITRFVVYSEKIN